MNTDTQASLPGVEGAKPTGTQVAKPRKPKLVDAGNGKEPSDAMKKHAAYNKAKKSGAKAKPAAKGKAAKPAKVAKPAKAKKASGGKRTTYGADTKFVIETDNTREGTKMRDLMDVARGLKKFTRDELVKAASRKLTEKRARAFFSWSLGHGLFKAA